MFDESGIWHEETFDQPGYGAAAGLDIMNATQSYQNYRRAREAGVLATMLKLRQEGDVGHDVAMTDEGGRAMSGLGVSPESIDEMWQNDPEQKFTRAAQAMPPEEQTAENLQSAYLGAGGKYKDWATNENRFEGAAVRRKKADDAARKDLSKAIDDAYKTNLAISDDQDQAVQRTANQVRARGLSEDEERQVSAWETASTGGKIGGATAAKVEETKAKTTLTKAKAKATLETLPGRINVLNSHAVLMKAQATHQAAMAEHANGTSKLTPKDLLNYAAKMEKLANDAQKNADSALDEGAKARMLKDAKGYAAEAETAKQEARELNAAPPAAAPAAKTPPPAAKTTTTPPPAAAAPALTPAEQKLIDQVKAGKMTADEARQARALLGS